MRPRFLLALLVAPTLLACVQRDDGFLLLRRHELRLDNERTPLAYAGPNEVTALHVRRLLADGFGAELLRTYAMSRRLADRGSDPAIVALGSEDTLRGVPYRDRQFDSGWFKEVVPATTPIVWIDEVAHTPVVVQLTTGLAGAIVDTVTGTATRAPDVLRDGYAKFLTVVAGEWNAPPGIDEREELRRQPTFARVRANDAAAPNWGCTGLGLRSGWEMVRDPEIVAAVLRHMASSSLSQRMAPEEIYRPFLTDAAPHGIHPARLLGAFRNFQAKLLAAWHGAVRAGRPPQDIVQLVEAYMDAFPAERAEATRILLVTTWGATVIPHETDLRDRPTLEQVNADVLFGTRGLRDGLAPARHDL